MDRVKKSNSFMEIPIIWVIVTRFASDLSAEPGQAYTARLPVAEVERLGRFRRWEDRTAGLLGKMLLQVGFFRCGLAPLNWSQWSRTMHGKPVILDGPQFNISHSGSHVVCAVTKKGSLGIDIEGITTVDLTEFSNYFKPDELRRLSHGKDWNSRFFELWTQKESILKADGRGMHLDPHCVSIVGNLGQVDDGKTFYLHMLKIDPEYQCCLATSEEKANIQIVYLSPEAILTHIGTM
jgi:4'-phosphopantetheinyl transferase